MLTEQEKENILDLVSCRTQFLSLIRNTEREDIIKFAVEHANIRELIYILEQTNVDFTGEQALDGLKLKGSHGDFYYLSKYTKIEDIAIEIFNLFKKSSTHEEMLSVSKYAKFASVGNMAYESVKESMTHEELYEFSKFGETEEIRIDSFDRLIKLGNVSQEELQKIIDYSKSGENKRKASDMLEHG